MNNKGANYTSNMAVLWRHAVIVARCVASDLGVCICVCADEGNNESKLCSHQTDPPGPIQSLGFERKAVRKSTYQLTKYQSETVIHLF